MTPFVRCPSTLATGYSSYSPTAIKTLFDGVSVSPVLTFDGPSSEEREAKEAIRNQGRISLSGVQPKFSMVIGENNKLRYTREGEQGHYILKPAPTSYHIF
jgi:serine/threonine-protein kinase HipA